MVCHITIFLIIAPEKEWEHVVVDERIADSIVVFTQSLIVNTVAVQWEINRRVFRYLLSMSRSLNETTKASVIATKRKYVQFLMSNDHDDRFNHSGTGLSIQR